MRRVLQPWSESNGHNISGRWLSSCPVDALQRHLNVSACCTRHEAAFLLMMSGYVLLDFCILPITFAPQWSNLLWEVFATLMGTPHDQSVTMSVPLRAPARAQCDLLILGS